MENAVLPNKLYIDESELFNSADEKAQKCSQLVGGKVVEDVYWYPTTEIFNFGRCLSTGTYCALDESCILGDSSNFYVPTKCTLKSINDLSDFKPISEMCKSTCGDGRCDRDEIADFNAPTRCDADCLKPKTPKVGCGDGECRAKDGEDTKNCPADCIIPTAKP
jgi:hypothetical protein